MKVNPRAVLVVGVFLVFGWWIGLAVTQQQTSLGPVECGFGEPTISIRTDGDLASRVTGGVPLMCTGLKPYQFAFRTPGGNVFGKEDRFACSLTQVDTHWSLGVLPRVGISDIWTKVYGDDCHKV